MSEGIGDDTALAARIGEYLRAQTGQAVRVGAVTRFPVGFSWLTFAVPVQGLQGFEGFEGFDERVPGEGGGGDADGGTELILRLGPEDGLFAPYSAAPQVLAMQSLQGSAVPVPRVYWHGDDPAVFGAPFLFCQKVEGSAVVPWVAPDAPPLADDYRRSLGTDFIDALGALHRVDWRHQPIAALASGITEQTAARQQVAHYEALIERWAMRPYPLAEFGIRWLKAHAPVAPAVTIVHGDYRTGNFLEMGGRITTILDWELAHLGDPHEDIAWASLPMYKGGSPYLCRLCEADWFHERWQQQSGLVLSMASVRYYQVFSLLKLAATHMAAARCFEEGRFHDMRMPAMGSQVATCLRQMDKLIDAA